MDSLSWVVFHPFELVVLYQLIGLVALLLCSGFASASEVAFFSLTPNDVNTLSKSSSRGAETALRLSGMPDYLLATILILNNLVNICAVIVANAILDQLVAFNSVAIEFLIKTVLLTFLLLLFGEIMPKLLSAANARRVVQFASVPLMGLKHLFKPFSWLLIHFSNGIGRRLAVKRENISMDEISDAVEITSDQSVEEKRILSGIANFVHTQVEEIMRPRVDIVAVDAEVDFLTVCETVKKSGFSRIPVYEESIDHIRGILYVKDLLPYLDSGDDYGWQGLMRPPYFVPEHKRINDLFTEFQNQKIHIAIVVDEYGSTMGLVSLEDILEEIIGEIADESDVDRSYYTQLDPDTYIFEGKTHILDFLKITGSDDDYLDAFKGESETIAGMMMEAKRDFLKKGDTLSFRCYTMTVEAIEGRRIAKIRVRIDRQYTDQGSS
ncbi:MAG: gliding motility-associated protein GldE [Rikenellaceae bacterium]|jgi:gliding motility-associated protein GldE|nr:gliding motility-associated protein GldE [Rikenellaceae bacterium]